MIRSGLIIMIKDFAAKGKRAGEISREIQGLNAAEALEILKLVPRKSARLVAKTLASAIANAENNHKLNIDKLVVAEAYTGNGIVMKRMHARGRGRGARVLKPFSKLTIVVAERGE